MSSACDGVADISIGTVIAQHLRDLEFHKSYPRDIVDAHRQCLARFRRFLNRKGVFFCADVRAENIDSLLCSVGGSLATRNKHREVIGGLFKFAAEMGCRQAADPARPPRQPRKPENYEPMPAAMVGELLAGVTDPAQRAMAYLMVCAGLSPEELRTLRVGDIHLDDSPSYLMVPGTVPQPRRKTPAPARSAADDAALAARPVPAQSPLRGWWATDRRNTPIRPLTPRCRRPVEVNK